MSLTLSTTTTFNHLNNIQTNEDKAVLLTTVTPDVNGYFVFTLRDNTTVTICPLELTQATRILGVWLSASKSTQHIFTQVKKEVQ